MSEAFYSAFLQNPELWRVFFPPGFVAPSENNPNYVAADHGPLMEGVAIVNIILSVFVVFPRLISRLFVVRSFRLDDWLIIPAFFAHMCSCGVIIWSTHNAGLGKHVYDCTPLEIKNWYRIQYIMNITQLTGLFLTRMSILFFLMSLAGNAELKSRYAIISVQVVNAIHWPAVMLPTIFMCVPEFHNWSLLRLVASGCMADSNKVVAIQRAGVAMGAIGVVLDFVILAIPIRLVWKLRLPVKQRVVVSGLFAIGSLACIASVCKAAYTVKQSVSNKKTFDLSWTFVPIFISGLFEQTLALVTACGPGLKPLFSRSFPLLISTLRGGSRSKLSDSGNPGSGYSREGKGTGVGTIGGTGGKKLGKGGKYGVESIGMSTVDSRSSIIERGDEEMGREAEWRGNPV